MATPPLMMFTIYAQPADFPDDYVVRRWSISAGLAIADLEPLCVTPSLEVARAAIPHGLHRLARDPIDDPVIVETWL